MITFTNLGNVREGKDKAQAPDDKYPSSITIAITLSNNNNSWRRLFSDPSQERPLEYPWNGKTLDG